jgi:hypothetical protein
MRKTETVSAWVVYSIAGGKQAGVMAVCSEGEWAALEIASPGGQTLVRAGIRSEGEAEVLARGTSGEPKKRSIVR